MEEVFKNQLESFRWPGEATEAVSPFDKGKQSPRDRMQAIGLKVNICRLKRRKS